jgi:hypothetical protein
MAREDTVPPHNHSIDDLPVQAVTSGRILVHDGTSWHTVGNA